MNLTLKIVGKTFSSSLMRLPGTRKCCWSLLIQCLITSPPFICRSGHTRVTLVPSACLPPAPKQTHLAESVLTCDSHVLNYVKSERCPPSAGTPPLAQRRFIALPSLHCGDAGETKSKALTSRGHLLGSPPRCTLCRGITLLLDVTESLCRRHFCVSGQSVKERKENNPNAFR